jgi:hypothetical protein
MVGDSRASLKAMLANKRPDPGQFRKISTSQYNG